MKLKFHNLLQMLGVFKFRKLGCADLYLQYRPDRYSPHMESLYRERSNFYQPGDLDDWNRNNYASNIGDHARFYFLSLCMDFILEEGIVGAVGEVGVYKGNSAAMLAKLARRLETKLYLFDTFEGFDQKDLVGADQHHGGDWFSDTSLTAVRKFIGEANVQYVKGYFPDSLTQVKEEPTFCLAHIDCDLAKPMESALEYFYPRMVKGGFLVVHDHTSLLWDGAISVINRFFEDKPEYLIPIPDKSGTSVIRKL